MSKRFVTKGRFKFSNVFFDFALYTSFTNRFNMNDFLSVLDSKGVKERTSKLYQEIFAAEFALADKKLCR